MVTLEIGKEIRTFDGKPIPADATGKPMVIKDVLLHYLGTFNSKNGKSMIEAYQLGVKIAGHVEPEISLENAEFNLVKEAMQNPVHGALIIGQLNAVIEAAEATKK
jgi:hypothetical protein